MNTQKFLDQTSEQIFESIRVDAWYRSAFPMYDSFALEQQRTIDWITLCGYIQSVVIVKIRALLPASKQQPFLSLEALQQIVCDAREERSEYNVLDHELLGIIERHADRILLEVLPSVDSLSMDGIVYPIQALLKSEMGIEA